VSAAPILSLLLGMLAGWGAVDLLYTRGFLDIAIRAVWRVLHRRGCPLPLNVRRKELLQSYQTYSMGMPWQVEVFDIRALCPRCGRTHRLETKIFTQINTYL